MKKALITILAITILTSCAMQKAPAAEETSVCETTVTTDEAVNMIDPDMAQHPFVKDETSTCKTSEPAKITPAIKKTSFDGFYQDSFYDVYDEALFAMPSHIDIAKEFMLQSGKLNEDYYDVNSVDDIFFVHGANVDFEHDGKNESVIEFDFKYNGEILFPLSATVFVNDCGKCELLSIGNASSEFSVLHYADFDVLNLYLWSDGTDWVCELLTVDNGKTNVRVGRGSDSFEQHGAVMLWRNKYDFNNNPPCRIIVWDSESKQFCQLGEDEITENAFIERVPNAQEYLSQARAFANAEIEKIYTIGYYHFFFEFTENKEKKAVYGCFDGEKIVLNDCPRSHDDKYLSDFTDNDTLLHGIDYYGITEKNVPECDYEIVTIENEKISKDVSAKECDNVRNSMKDFYQKYNLFTSSEDENLRISKVGTDNKYLVVGEYHSFLLDNNKLYLQVKSNTYNDNGRDMAVLSLGENVDADEYFIELGK